MYFICETTVFVRFDMFNGEQNGVFSKKENAATASIVKVSSNVLNCKKEALQIFLHPNNSQKCTLLNVGC